MKRYKSNPRKRALIDDAEIRAFWHATETLGTYGALARVCLLTGQRRAKVNHMKWTDIDAEGIWRLGHTPREKPNCGAIKLPPFVLAIIKARPRLEKNPYVFPALRKRGPFNAFGQLALTMTKREREVLPEMAPHTVHDLRRRFRICPRLGIDRDIAERCLGHTIGNAIERTYDQYPYLDEMGVAFATFARHVQAVVTPAPQNVVRLNRERVQARRARAPSSGTP
jgi:integrase